MDSQQNIQSDKESFGDVVPARIWGIPVVETSLIPPNTIAFIGENLVAVNTEPIPNDKPDEPTLTREQKWALARADHTCTCVNCDSTLKLPAERTNKNHVGVRFWEGNPDEEREQYGRYVFVNDVQVYAFEAILGNEGVAWVFRGRDKPFGAHICQTCLDNDGCTPKSHEKGFCAQYADSAVCTQKLYGKVELR